jgi:hypothetical protein
VFDVVEDFSLDKGDKGTGPEGINERASKQAGEDWEVDRVVVDSRSTDASVK